MVLPWSRGLPFAGFLGQPTGANLACGLLIAFGGILEVFYYSRDKVVRLYVLRSLLAPRVSARWTDFIRRYYRDAGAGGPPSRVLAKPLRSYLHNRFGPARRLKALIDHYEQIDDIFSRECMRAFCAGKSIPVANFAGRKSTRFTLSIAASVTALTQREGELAIFIAKDSDDVKLSRLSLCFATIDGERALVVGGIQGPKGGHKRKVIDATRELYGMRPKDAVFLAARALARAVLVTSVHAVSDANHVLNRLQDVQKFAGYDEYWVERGGAFGGPFGFVFEPLDSPTAGTKGRDQLKAAMVEAMRSFAATHGRRPAAAPVIAPIGALAPA